MFSKKKHQITLLDYFYLIEKKICAEIENKMNIIKLCEMLLIMFYPPFLVYKICVLGYVITEKLKSFNLCLKQARKILVYEDSFTYKVLYQVRVGNI